VQKTGRSQHTRACHDQERRPKHTNKPENRGHFNAHMYMCWEKDTEHTHIHNMPGMPRHPPLLRKTPQHTYARKRKSRHTKQYRTQ